MVDPPPPVVASPRALVVVMPRRSTEWANAAAMWITAAGWAAAGERRLGHAWVITPDAVSSATEVESFPDRPGPARPGPRPTRRRVPEPLVTLAKDVRRAATTAAYGRRAHHGPWEATQVALVWQHHDLFHRTGERLARALHAPLVTYVHAPQVWEAATWGVRRPGWGRALERLGERPALVHSDLVACVSEEVVDEVVRLGVDRRRTLVSPMAVDAERFTPAVRGIAIRERLGLADAFVVGWSGSFRGFHGLDVLLDAFARVRHHEPRARLLLAGDGPQRAVVAAQAERLGVTDAMVMPGSVPFGRMPEVVAAMDAAVVVARAGESFHYSPLKMREYMASARPVVAPAVGEIPKVIDDGVSGLLYEAGDVDGLARRLVDLAGAPTRRTRLGAAARRYILGQGTWDVQLGRVLARLGVADRMVGDPS